MNAIFYNCRNITFLILVLVSVATLVAGTPSVVMARGNSNGRFALTAMNSTYSNLGDPPLVASNALGSSITVEAMLRIMTVYNLIFSYDQFSADSSLAPDYVSQRSALGLGFKINLPGFFFVGGSKSDSSRDGKKYPVNTFIVGSILQVNTTNSAGVKTALYGNRYGFGLDIFLYNRYVYFTAFGGVVSHAGDNYIQNSLGLGANF